MDLFEWGKYRCRSRFHVGSIPPLANFASGSTFTFSPLFKATRCPWSLIRRQATSSTQLVRSLCGQSRRQVRQRRIQRNLRQRYAKEEGRPVSLFSRPTIGPPSRRDSRVFESRWMPSQLSINPFIHHWSSWEKSSCLPAIWNAQNAMRPTGLRNRTNFAPAVVRCS